MVQRREEPPGRGSARGAGEGAESGPDPRPDPRPDTGVGPGVGPGAGPARGPAGRPIDWGSVRRLGLFGGSFDPIHRGHLHAARAAQAAFRLDRVLFVPAHRSPHKPGSRPASAEHRLAMVELALAGEPTWSSSDLELRRGGASYTWDTVRSLPAELGLAPGCELFLVLGSDNLDQLGAWREVRALLERVQPVVVDRGGDVEHGLERVRAALGDALADKVARGLVRLPPVEASSTELREELGGERTADELATLPDAVADYVRAHGLYGADA